MARRSVHCPVCNQAVNVEVSQTGICVVPEHGPRRACKAGGQVFKYQEALTQAQYNRRLHEALERRDAQALANPVLGEKSTDTEQPVLLYSKDLESRAMEAAFARE